DPADAVGGPRGLRSPVPATWRTKRRRQKRSEVASPSARDVAAGSARLERSEASSSTARDVATGSTRARGGKEAVTEADVLRRYESGDVVGAREQARAARLTALHAQLARFESAEAESRKAQSKGDLPRAISQLTTAVSVDHALAQGWSKHGDSLRKRLSQLHVKQGLEHARAGETSEARAAFEQAVKYDAGNREAHERLGRLSSAAAP
ncbi:nuclease PIN, partial [Pyxidicoccus sp. 3LG]